MYRAPRYDSICYIIQFIIAQHPERVPLRALLSTIWLIASCPRRALSRIIQFKPIGVIFGISLAGNVTRYLWSQKHINRGIFSAFAHSFQSSTREHLAIARQLSSILTYQYILETPWIETTLKGGYWKTALAQG